MKIDKAIEIQERVFKDRSRSSDVEVFDAIQLGIEALKLVKHLRHPEFLRYLCLLPGETGE